MENLIENKYCASINIITFVIQKWDFTSFLSSTIVKCGGEGFIVFKI